MFTQLPSYAIANVRRGFRVNERHQINWALENIFDKPHRNPSWGIDSPGINVRFSYRMTF